MNKVFLSGRIANDIELKNTSSGKQYLHSCIAVSRTGSDGTDFVNIKAFDKTAESLAKWVKKGMKIIVIGHMSVYQHEREGVKTTYTDVVVDLWEFCEKKQDQSNGSSSDGGNTDSFIEISDGIDSDMMPFN